MLRYLASLGLILLFTGPVQADPQADVSLALDSFHAAASRADQPGYLGLLTDDAVFLGTDASERWQGQAFRDFVASHYGNGNGWTYVATQRHISVAADSTFAWFDELLDNEQLGVCRGSGILLLTADGWKIAQYNLSVPVPNALVGGVATAIRALAAGGELEVEQERNQRGELESVEIEVELVTDAEDDDEESTAVDDADATTQPHKRCGKRHKTNRKSDC
jgi:ketosteroid isomerase-like protein